MNSFDRRVISLTHSILNCLSDELNSDKNNSMVVILSAIGKVMTDLSKNKILCNFQNSNKLVSKKDLKSTLKKIRENKNISVYELSKISGVSHTMIYRIENGKQKYPSPMILKKLSKALFIDFDILFSTIEWG